ncbi:MAG: cobalamin B12-binding domain-containing protein, partial [Clostridiales bacterium]|nr:cobalamin B12-binding domain-containing protein [Clostridiales bacterium]
MLTLLTSLCASYTHTPLALYALKAYAVSREPDLAEEILIESFTINQTDGFILRGIYRRKPDAVGFSCYGWNMEKTVRVASALRKLLPGIKIIFGGPEMAAEHEEYLARGIADAVIRGEGEQAFYEWLADWRSRQKGTGSAKRGDIPAAVPLDLSRLPFPYPRDLSGLENKIIYYEASRGCPFSCGYCLSS